MVLMRGLAVIAAVGLLAAAAANGCSSGLSEADAQARCSTAQSEDTACVDTAAFVQCTSCFEACGSDCAPQGLCPEQFLCPGQSVLSGVGGSGGASVSSSVSGGGFGGGFGGFSSFGSGIDGG